MNNNIEKKEGWIEQLISFSAHNKYFDNTSSTIVAYFNFGYRYQPIKKGWSYRVFLSPLLTSEGLIPF